MILVVQSSNQVVADKEHYLKQQVTENPTFAAVVFLYSLLPPFFCTAAAASPLKDVCLSRKQFVFLFENVRVRLKLSLILKLRVAFLFTLAY